MKNYMYIFVREDLSGPQRVVQACHAAIEASAFYHLDDLEHPSVIILGVKDEQELEQVEKELPYFFHYEVFKEPHWDHQKTSLAVFPVREDYREWFAKFKLLR